MFAKIYVNETYVAQTKVNILQWPSFEIEFKELLQINVYTRPTKIEIELYMGTDSLNIVSRFEIEAPGIFTKTITSTSTLAEIIDFETDIDTLELIKDNQGEKKKDVIIEPSKNHSGESKSFLESSKNLPRLDPGMFPERDQESHIPLAQAPNAHRSLRKIRGKLFVQAEWDGLGPDMPPTKIENRVDIFTKQKEFQEKYQMKFAYDYPFDINDPRNVIFFDKMKKLKAEYILKNVYKEFLLPLSEIESLRHYLLKKRVDRSSLRELQIPILESEIVRNEEMKELIKDLRKTDINETDEEAEMKKNMQIDNINKTYGGRFLEHTEYLELLSKKIKAMKRDVVAKLQLSYGQVINEFDFKLDCRFVLEIFKFFFNPPRRLRPLKKRKNKVKIEKATSITMNIHIVKGYNIPVRKEAIKYNYREQVKKDAIEKIYLGGAGSGLADNIVNNMNKSQNISGNNMRNSYVNPGTGNHSFNQGGGAMPFAMNNSRGDKGGSFLQKSGQWDNPNTNFMNNPNNLMQGSGNNFPMYNQPNTVNQEVDLIKNYDGSDLLNMIGLLKGVEKNVESFVQVKMLYYDQEIDKRTDSISGIHPDYNTKLKFKIKPRNGEQYFSKTEIQKCTGVLYFTIYDEVRSEHRLQEKDANTYIYRYEKKYIGSFSIPFTTIYQSANMMESLCKVKVPLTVFGYYSDYSAKFSTTENKKNNEDSKDKDKKKIEDKELLDSWIVNPNINTYVSLYINIDPILSLFSNEEIDYVPGIIKF